MRLLRATSAMTARSVVLSTRRSSSSRSILRRPYRPTVSRRSVDTDGGTGNREYFSSVASISSAVWPAARAFQRPRRVMRYV